MEVCPDPPAEPGKCPLRTPRYYTQCDVPSIQQCGYGRDCCGNVAELFKCVEGKWQRGRDDSGKPLLNCPHFP